MAFPGNSVTSLAGKWDLITSHTGTLKNRCVALNAKAAITRVEVLVFQNQLADTLDSLATLIANATTNGLLEYAREQVNNPSLDLTAEYNAMRTQLIACQDWVVANFPATTGELRVYSFDGNKRYANVDLTAGQLSAFKTQLTNLANTIS